MQKLIEPGDLLDNRSSNTSNPDSGVYFHAKRSESSSIDFNNGFQLHSSHRVFGCVDRGFDISLGLLHDQWSIRFQKGQKYREGSFHHEIIRGR